jgi:hypothetical protein
VGRISNEDMIGRRRAILCKFCEHWYIRPCTATTQAKCPNMIFKRGHSNSSLQASIRHHYIPVFYLKRWRGNDGRICEFSRPYREIYSRRIYPIQTGFVDRLYEMKGVPAAIAQRVEDEFMKPVDSLASIALAMLENQDEKITHDAKYRSAWSLFLMALLMRMPEDLVVLSLALADEWAREFPKLEEKYANKRKPDDPPTLQEFIDKNDPDYMARWAMNVAPKLMDHGGIGQLLNDMRWFVLTTAEDLMPFLTSDRPVLISATLTEENAYVFLPIGPHRLFVAVKDDETERLVRQRPLVELIQSSNKLVTRHATKYVYGIDAIETKFVDEHLSQGRPKSILERLRDLRNAKATASEKPAH